MSREKNGPFHHHKEALLALQNLNERIVEARRKGAHGEVERLKQEVRALLAEQKKTTTSVSPREAPTHPASPHISGPSPTSSYQVAPDGAEDTTKTNPQQEIVDHKSLIQQLQELNMRIVEARKQGDDATVERLKAQAKRVMQQGGKQTTT